MDEGTQGKWFTDQDGLRKAIAKGMEEAFPQHDPDVFTEAMKHIIAADHFKWDVKTLYPDPNQE
ncbi:hypothetical protein JL720_12231 [Aureococcus anophagefferens]|nr:hypothetical protein JL720_12231 [Aureococcus anophagefferens]